MQPKDISTSTHKLEIKQQKAQHNTLYAQVYIVSEFQDVKPLIPALVEGTSVREADVGITAKPVDTLGVIGSDLTEADTDTAAGVTLLHPCTVAPSTASTTGERTSDTSTELEKNPLFLYITYKLIEPFSVRNFSS